eukprot:5171513-Pleurochrysis_carterae.AAC.1
MPAQPSETDRAAVAAYQELKEAVSDYCQREEFSVSNTMLLCMDNHQVPTAALYSYFINQHPAVLPIVCDDLSAHFHDNDEYNANEDTVFDLIGDAPFPQIHAYGLPIVNARKWKSFVNTMAERYEIFSLRSHIQEKEVKLLLPPSGNLKDDFVYYVRMAY